jgi:hypothetical protein
MGTNRFQNILERGIPEIESKNLQKKQTRRRYEAQGGRYQKKAAQMTV